jgi:tRNA-specific 2-thiouridylase
MKKLMLAMSGGVDSSVALLLLKEKYEVRGATMSLFEGSETVVNDAESIAGRFGIPHRVFDLSECFNERVISGFVSSYLSGETPNPCVVCNKHVKFGALFDSAKSLGCELMATGHYARVEYDTGSGRYLLKKAASGKDQSYVLYSLTQEQLGRTVFPLGNLDKNRVRELAAEQNLFNSDKPDSQDICFVPDGDYAGFITRYTGKTPESGMITDKDGNVLGTHKGIINYTVGQRKGLGLSAPNPLYVTAKDALSNRIIAGGNEELFSKTLTARELNWLVFPQLKGKLQLYAKTRYSQAEEPCTVFPLDDGRVRVEFFTPQRAVTPGQSVVFYDGDTVIGGGVIDK